MSRRRADRGYRRRPLTAIILVASMIIGAASATLAPNAQPALAAPGDGFAVSIAGPAALTLGESGTYTISVTNNDVDANDVVLYLDPYFTASIAVTDAGDWTCTAAFRGRECTRSSLAVGTTAPPIVVSLTPAIGGTSYLTASAQSGAINGYHQAEACVVAGADLALT